MRRASPSWCLLLALFAAPALAAPDCEDDYSECKDDCVIAYGGSARLDMKKSYDKCVRKCTKVEGLCTEHEVETRTNHLEEGALDRSPGSDEVDSNNMPTRTTVGQKKPKKVEAPANEADEDAPARAREAPKKLKKAAPVEASANEADEAAPAKPREALGESEVPRSSRTQLKSEDDNPAKAGKPGKASAEAPTKPREESARERSSEKPRRGREEASSSARVEPKAERLDEDVRDDQPRAEKGSPRSEPKEEAPPPRAKKAEEKPKDVPPPKHKEEDDDLRNF